MRGVDSVDDVIAFSLGLINEMLRNLTKVRSCANYR